MSDIEAALANARRQAAKYRAERNAARADQRTLILERVARWMEDTDDFEKWIELGDVLVDGRLDDDLLEARVRDLLVRKPHLAKRTH